MQDMDLTEETKKKLQETIKVSNTYDCSSLRAWKQISHKGGQKETARGHQGQ